MRPVPSGEGERGKFMSRFARLIWVAAFVAAAACSNANVAPGDPAAIANTPPPTYTYPLAGGDKLRVIVYDAPDLGGEFTIGGTGTIAMPLVGEVSALGLTTTELAKRVQDKLAQGVMKDPRVSVEVLNYRPYYILGEVNKPGEYPFTNGLTVLSAVADGGGFTYRANTKHVLIKHAGEEVTREYKIDATVKILPGDTIQVKERWF